MAATASVPALGASFIRADEPCLSLSEVNLQSPGSRGWHRYQILYVIRKDRPAEWRKDLGPAKNFTADQFRVPGGFIHPGGRIEIVHTVAELQEIAEYLRGGFIEKPQMQPSDLWGRYRDQIDEVFRRRRGRSTFGAKVKVQRG